MVVSVGPVTDVQYELIGGQRLLNLNACRYILLRIGIQAESSSMRYGLGCVTTKTKGGQEAVI